MIIKNKQKLAKKALAAVFMTAGALCAADPLISESFESLDALPTGWLGTGSIAASAITANVYPVAYEHGEVNKVLTVDGDVTATVPDATMSAATVDMMVKVAVPDEQLSLPEGENADNIQVAAGIDKTETAGLGELKVWNGSNWQTTGKLFAIDSWIRITFLFNYQAKTFDMLVNGEPVKTGIALAKVDADKVASIKFIGSTAIDDLVVKHSATGAAVVPEVTTKVDGKTDMAVESNFVKTDASESAIKVDKQWLSDNGIVWTADAVNEKAEGEKLTVAQKYAAGFSPANDQQELKIESMNMVKEDNKIKVQMKLPVAKAGNGYKNVVQTKTPDSDWATAADNVQGENVAIELPTGEEKVRYYRVITTAE